MTTTSLALMALIAMTATLAGCAAETPPANSAYAAEFEDARANATSEFERDVLADSKISQSEYDEAMQRFAACARDRSVDVKLTEKAGMYVYSVPESSADIDSVLSTCEVGNNRYIESLFLDALMNPEKKDIEEVIAHCFVAMKVVPAPFTKAELRRLQQSAGIEIYAVTGASAAPLDTSGVAADPAAKEILNSTDAQNCQANPSYDLLVARDGR